MAPPRKLFVSLGQRFGRGVITDPESRWDRPDRPGGDRAAQLKCDCGTEYTAPISHLVKGNILSCGCQRGESSARNIRKLHKNPGEYHFPQPYGMTGHPLYYIWKGMLSRCENPSDKRYHRYGARGITVCERWHDIRLFITDIESTIGAKPARCHECGGRYSLDRINNGLGYEPGNVRWATDMQQAQNQG